MALTGVDDLAAPRRWAGRCGTGFVDLSARVLDLRGRLDVRGSEKVVSANSTQNECKAFLSANFVQKRNLLVIRHSVESVESELWHM